MTRSFVKPTANRDKVPEGLKETLRAACDYVCSICSDPQTKSLKLDIHHIIPRTLGGSNEPENLIPICKTCHAKIHSNNYVRIS